MTEKMDKKPIISLRNVIKKYGENLVVNKINLDIYQGEFLTLLGASGCGKTTTLRMIAGFEDITEGEIFLEDENMAGKPPYHRNVNTVFQSYALFPHMNVFDNVAFGLVEKKMKKAEIRKKVREVLELVQLTGFERRKPDQMSGGQKQRVAIARAIVNNPRVLLLDEPLGALDLKLRRQMQLDLKHLQQQLNITFVYVTHDQEEAMTMSDRIAIMNGGVFEQIGTAEEIYEHPKTKFVADFIGESNIFETSIHAVEEKMLKLIMEQGDVTVREQGFEVNEIAYLCVRPENIKISEFPVEGFNLKGIIKENIYVGSQIKTTIEMINGYLVKKTAFPDGDMKPAGSIVYLYWDDGKSVLMHTKEDKIYNYIESAEGGSIPS